MKDKENNNHFNETAFKYMTKPQGQYTIEDYDQLPEDSFVELIDGVLYDLSSPSVMHQIIATELLMRFKFFIKNSHGASRKVKRRRRDARIRHMYQQ